MEVVEVLVDPSCMHNLLSIPWYSLFVITSFQAEAEFRLNVVDVVMEGS